MKVAQSVNTVSPRAHIVRRTFTNLGGVVYAHQMYCGYSANDVNCTLTEVDSGELFTDVPGRSWCISCRSRARRLTMRV